MKSKFEMQIIKEIGAKPTKASGAIFDDADGRYKEYLIECKERLSNSLSISNSIWKKIKKQALQRGRKPAIFFKNSEYKFAILDLDDFIELVGE